MSEEDKQASRREFLKKTLRTTGYVLPLAVALKMSSRQAWADSYAKGASSAEATGGDGKCNSFAEKIFNTSCW